MNNTERLVRLETKVDAHDQRIDDVREGFKYLFHMAVIVGITLFGAVVALFGALVTIMFTHQW